MSHLDSEADAASPGSAPGAWGRLLEGRLADEAQHAVRGVGQSLARSLGVSGAAPDAAEGTRGASFASGWAGWALLFAYLDQVWPEEGYRAAAIRCLDHAAGLLAAERLRASLYGGFTGVAWATDHLHHRLDPSGPDRLGDIDEVVLGLVGQRPWNRDYDLINGLVGFGVYALDRRPRPPAVSALEQVVDRLEETAERDADGVTWHTRPELLPDRQRRQCPGGYYNLGLAHGLAGVIALLGRTCAAGIVVAKATALLRGAVSWLLAQDAATGGRGFAAWLAAGHRPERSRSAWCYGDPGIAAALLVAGRGAAEPEWEAAALRIGRRAVERPQDGAGVRDAGLCHGAAGLGHVFNRMFQATGDGDFAGAARFWFERALEMRRPDEGPGGFVSDHQDADGTAHWVADPGLLTGAAGVALALLAATTAVEPAWDRILLLPDFRP